MANLKFTSSGSTTIQLVAVGTPLTNNFTANGSAYTLGTVISLSDGDELTFAGSTNKFSQDSSNYYKFIIGGTGTVTIEGDLISLINNNTQIEQYQFYNLFKGCSQITSISGLAFPSSIADWCYANMFMDCTGLVDAGTTLPATYTSVWCYEGMFARCTSLVTPPTILSEQLAPFCYYGMFQGCSSLTDGPQLLNRVVSGDFSTNIMFKDCTNLSSIHVSFTSWPADAAHNESRKWLSGVAQDGVFIYPTTLTTIPTGGVVPAGWTLSSTYPAQVVVADQSYSFDAMSNTYQSKSFYYSYNGEDTLNVTVDTTNKPSWLNYQKLTTSIYFSAQGYSIDSSATVQIPITFSAADAAPVTAYATFAIDNYPTNPITVNAIPTFSFDATSQTNIVSSLLDYVTYGGSTLSCTVTGELPTGLSCVNGVITGTPSQFTNNYSGSFNIEYSAQDARPVASSFNVEIINAAPDYSTMPLTFKSSGSTTVKIQKGNLSYNKNGTGWTGYTSNSSISLSDGDTVAFSGTNTQISAKFVTTGTGTLSAYGNPHSLINWGSMTSLSCFCFLFNNCSNLVDASNLILSATTLTNYCYCEMFSYSAISAAPKVLPATNLASHCYHGMFGACYKLTKAPIILATNTSTDGCFAWMFNTSNVPIVEVKATSWNTGNCTNWIGTGNNTSSSCIFIKPSSWSNPSRGTSCIPNNWTILNRMSDNSLQYTNGTPYTGDDPYAYYYQ